MLLAFLAAVYVVQGRYLQPPPSDPRSSSTYCDGPLSCLSCTLLQFCQRVHVEDRFTEVEIVECKNNYPYCDPTQNKCVDYTPPQCGEPVPQNCYTEGTYPNLLDCNRYFISSDLGTKSYRCGYKEVFDIRKGKCSENGECGTALCAGIEGRHVAVEQNPRYYALCIHDRIAILGKCKEDEMYNETLQNCKVLPGERKNKSFGTLPRVSHTLVFALIYILHNGNIFYI